MRSPRHRHPCALVRRRPSPRPLRSSWRVRPRRQATALLLLRWRAGTSRRPVQRASLAATRSSGRSGSHVTRSAARAVSPPHRRRQGSCRARLLRPGRGVVARDTHVGGTVLSSLDLSGTTTTACARRRPSRARRDPERSLAIETLRFSLSAEQATPPASPAVALPRARDRWDHVHGHRQEPPRDVRRAPPRRPSRWPGRRT